MISALHAFGWEHQLVEPADLEGAVIGISAELLVALSPAEIAARLTSGTTSNPASKHFVVVFDGPGRKVPGKLDDGLVRRRMMRALTDAGVPFFVAPCLAAAQLAYLHKHQFVSHVSGSDEVWLWEDVPIVLDVFAAQPHLMRRQPVLNQLRFGERSFIEVICGLGGNAVIEKPFPMLENQVPPILDTVIRCAVQVGGPPPPQPMGDSSPSPTSPTVSIYRAAQQIGNPAYLAALQVALTFIARQPILNITGTVELVNQTDQPLPKDLVEVIGCNVSPAITGFINKGLLGPELVKGMVWGEYSDYFKINGDQNGKTDLGPLMEKLQRALSPVRQQSYSILVSTTHRYFQMKEVVVRTPGASNFSRTVTPKFPSVTPTENKDDPAVIASSAVNDAISQLRQLIQIEGTIPELPELFTAKICEDSKQLAHVLVQATTLAFRQYVESCLYWMVAKDQISVSIPKLVAALPWV